MHTLSILALHLALECLYMWESGFYILHLGAIYLAFVGVLMSLDDCDFVI